MDFTPPSPIPEDQDHKSIFLEGGDVLLNGPEIYVGISGCTSNIKGVEWLQQYLGANYNIHAIHLTPDTLHLDCALSLIKPGFGIICRDKIIGELSNSLRNFEFLEITLQEANMFGSNACILDQSTLIIDSDNERIVDELRKRKLEVIPLSCRAPITFGGGFRCLHQPLIRE